jgi:ABC-type transport system involved in multi-copper enzyme maturation permease subunit
MPSPGKVERAGGRLSVLDIQVAAALVLGSVATWWFYGRLSLLVKVGAWALLLAATAVLSRRGWLKLFGPVLFYDLIRSARRSRYVWLRCLYAASLIFILYLDYRQLFIGPAARGVSRQTMAAFAEQFFFKFALLQFGVVVVLTPIYSASAIAEEKERKTLEFLLATDLRNREIVLSKVVSRLVSLSLIVLTGLPILSFVQFLGGVDPDLLLATFAATGLTMLSLASLSILHSVQTRKARDAILLTYLSIVAYLGLGFLAEAVRINPSSAHMGLWLGSHFVTVADVASAFNAGNLPAVLLDLRRSLALGKPITGVLGGLLRGYAIWHGVATVVCAGLAVLRLRTVALRQQTGPVRKPTAKARVWWRPRIGLLPMLWKELFIEPGFRVNWVGRIVIGLFVLASFLPVVNILRHFQASGPTTGRMGLAITSRWAALGQELNPWVRLMGTTVACLMLVGVAVRASTSISGERDRETLDGLLTSPLHSHDILFAKWLGSLLSVRWAFVWLGLIWGVGLVSRAIHPTAIILICAAWLVYASCLAGVGLWFSTACRTTLRATLSTLATTALVGGGHWLLWMCCLPFGFRSGGLGSFFNLQSVFTPPMALYFLSADEIGVESWEIQGILVCFGLLAWAMAALVLWTVTRARFRMMTARMPYRRPEGRRALAVTGWGSWQEVESWEKAGKSVN